MSGMPNISESTLPNASIDPQNVKERIISILSTSKNTISEEELSMRMSNVVKEVRLNALNGLIKENRIRAIQNKDKMILFEIVVEEQSPEDAVYEIIKAEDKNGIWTRDIRSKSKLPLLILNKVLKTLEQKKLIKTVKTITNRKLYILFDLEPDESVTGGACYESGVLSDVLKNLKDACFQFVFNRFENGFNQMIKSSTDISEDSDNINQIYVTSNDILTEFSKRNVFKDIKVNELEHILDILVYESKLSKIKIGSRICHLYNDCLPGSVNISPENCDYISVEKF